MSDSRAFGQLEGRVAALESRVDGIDERIDKRLEKIEKSVGELSKALNMGRGALWATTKLGAAMLVIAAAGGWIWDHVVAPFLTTRGH